MASLRHVCWVRSIHFICLIPVLLSGYKAFTRGAEFWRDYTFSWGYSLAPFVVFAALLLLIVSWVVIYRIKHGVWTLRIPSLVNADITNGAAPKYMEQNTGKWERRLDRLLNPI
jgi:hypothetical protein